MWRSKDWQVQVYDYEAGADAMLKAVTQHIEETVNPYQEWVDDVFPRHPKTWEVFEETRHNILNELRGKE